jgi:hypothetical protein
VGGGMVKKVDEKETMATTSFRFIYKERVEGCPQSQQVTSTIWQRISGALGVAHW